jgi:VanZ family protein
VNRRPALFLWLYLTTILYLSLYPWRFVPDHGLKTFYWVPLVGRGTILDAFLNVVFYVPLGAAAFAALRWNRTVAAMTTLALGTMVSFAIERAQLFIPGRVSSWNDLLCNSAGTFVGIAVAFAASSPPLAARLRGMPSPRVLLLGLWALWQAFLFLPRYGPAIDVTHVIVGLAVLALVAVPWRIRAAAPLLLVWLVLDELRPFRFQGPPQAFWWLPFESWFAGAPDSYYGTFFGKLFLYTAILWVERRAGMQWIWAVLVPGAILFGGELAQRYLPGRTPEITDVVMLGAGAVLIHLAEPLG